MSISAEQRKVFTICSPDIGSDFESKFPIVEGSKISFKDSFLMHQPTSNTEYNLKMDIIIGIENHAFEDFRCPIMEPSIRDERIVFEEGRKPAVGKSANWWAFNATKFMPDKNSRLGNE